MFVFGGPGFVAPYLAHVSGQIKQKNPKPELRAKGNSLILNQHLGELMLIHDYVNYRLNVGLGPGGLGF